MRQQQHGSKTMYQLFEPSESTSEDVIFVGGDRWPYIVRNGFKWPVRFLAESIGIRTLASYPEHARAEMARLRPIQNAISNGVMKVLSISEKQVDVDSKNGIQLTLPDSQSLFWLSQCDLIKSCEYSQEWRFVKKVDTLRFNFEMQLG